MKHLLIPTDFSIRSLNAVHAAVAHYGEQEVKITLFHLLFMSNDISEMLFPSMRNKHFAMLGTDFKEACQVLENRYSSTVKQMDVKFGFGDTRAYLANLMEGLRIDAIVFCPDIELQRPSNRSVNMMPMLKKTGVPVIEIESKGTQINHTDINVINMLGGNEMRIPKTENSYATKE